MWQSSTAHIHVHQYMQHIHTHSIIINRETYACSLMFACTARLILFV